MSSKDETEAPEVLWTPQSLGDTSMDRYRLHVNSKFGLQLRTSAELHRWSVTSPHQFWIDLYSWLDLTPALPPTTKQAYDSSRPISSNPPFFTGLQRFNYAENALFSNPDPQAVALIGVREDTNLDEDAEEVLTWAHFREKVRVAASALRQCGRHISITIQKDASRRLMRVQASGKATESQLWWQHLCGQWCFFMPVCH